MNILNKLTIKHLKMNKRRTTVTIIGVILSTALMVGIGLLFSTVRDNTIQSIKQYTGDYHAKIMDFNYSDISRLDNKKMSFFYESEIGFTYLENNTNTSKPYLYINGVSETYFDELKLVEGRYPKNDMEVVISNHIITDGRVEYKVGDTLMFKVGSRFINGEKANNNQFYMHPEEESLVLEESKIYKIVGIVERSKYESYSAPGYTIYTLLSNRSTVDLYLRYNKISKTYDLTEKIIKDNNIKIENVVYNDNLLGAYGYSKYNNITDSLEYVIMIILGLLSIGCIIVIYNSFAISVMERKKHFGLFSSIGATRKQIRKTVFFEAIIVGLIGIPLGVLSGFLGIWILLEVVDKLIGGALDIPFTLAVYPTFVIIPVIFMIIVILISAFLPARKASKITPIEAIRQNDDIKINKKKLKTNNYITKFFGIEGEIALKNIKRNKKKYRITVLSLITSMVLFISFSSILNYGLTGSDEIYSTIDYDAYIYIFTPSENVNTKVNQILALDEVKKSVTYKEYSFPIELLSKKLYTKRYLDVKGEENIQVIEDYNAEEFGNYRYYNFLVLDDKSYNNYLNDLGLKEPEPIFIDRVTYISYTNNARKNYVLDMLKNNADLDIKFCYIDYENVQVPEPKVEENSNNSYNSIYTGEIPTGDCHSKLDNVYISDKIPFGLTDIIADGMFIINDDIYNELIGKYPFLEKDNYAGTKVVIEADKYTEMNKLGEELNKTNGATYYNVTEQLKLQRNVILVVKILLYGFISLVTLIGITSVFNTISTSIALRKKEFTMLRSMGLTPKGFNKLLYFESIFFGLKSILWAIPISLVVTFLIHLSVKDTMELPGLIIPYESIIISIFGVFIIVLITMLYSTKKIKKENIIDAIREENI